MKHVQKFAVAFLAVIVAGCGGTGNQAASKTVVNGTPRLEAIVKVLRTNLQHPTQWTDAQLVNPQTPGLQADLLDPTVFGIVDPTNIECGDKIIFQVVYYSADGTRHIVPNVNFASSDTSGTYGILAANTGEYIASVVPTTTPLVVSGSYGGFEYTSEYDLKIHQVRVIGSVLAQGTNANSLPGSKVQFFNAEGAVVDTVTVQSDGSIRASVPVVATSFSVVADSVPATFYQSFGYLGLQYDAGVVSCFAPLPSGLTVGTTNLPGAIYVAPRSDAGKPASSGCSGPVARTIKHL